VGHELRDGKCVHNSSGPAPSPDPEPTATAGRFLINSQSSVAFVGRGCHRLDITQSSGQSRAYFYFDWAGIDVYPTADCSGTARAGSRYQGFVDSAATINSARLRGGQASGTATITGRRDQSEFGSAAAAFSAATIAGLPSADDGPAGETYRRSFSVLGTNRAAAVAGSGCSLAEDTALRVGTTRHYTLSAKRSGQGQLACTITAGTASHTITITFNPITIDGLDATGSEKVGSTYQDPFSVLGTNRAAAVAGSGCSLAEDTALRAGTTRHHRIHRPAPAAHPHTHAGADRREAGSARGPRLHMAHPGQRAGGLHLGSGRRRHTRLHGQIRTDVQNPGNRQDISQPDNDNPHRSSPAG